MPETSQIIDMIKEQSGPLVRIDGRTHTARRPMGTVIITDPTATQFTVERDTLMCMHCQGHWVVEPGSGRERGWCNSCRGPLCGLEACITICVYWEDMIEQIEDNARRDANLAQLR